jgi:hypothetical protein
MRLIQDIEPLKMELKFRTDANSRADSLLPSLKKILCVYPARIVFLQMQRMGKPQNDEMIKPGPDPCGTPTQPPHAPPSSNGPGRDLPKPQPRQLFKEQTSALYNI